MDYRVPQVEIDGRVILREGLLELFAHSEAPNSKQHETIVLLGPAADQVYQALGLIGLTPGHPGRWDPQTQTYDPPTGDAVDVLVRYRVEGVEQTRSACDWMWDAQNDRVMPQTHWLFVGSERLEDGTLAANIDGTTVTVVDFPSSLVALPERHSESDSELWLNANTKEIPPLETPVTVILRPAELPRARAW